MAKKKSVVAVKRPTKPTEPTLVELAVYEPLPLPEVPLPTPPVEIEVGDFNDYTKEQPGKDGGVIAWLRAHLW
jgi:hypothetical protein